MRLAVRPSAVIALSFGLVLVSLRASAQTAPWVSPSGAAASDANDKYLWLEEPTSDRAMAWVKAENAKSAKVFEADPRFATYQAEALKVLEDPSRLAVPDLRGADDVYNFWRDSVHVRGILRKTTRADYATASPYWVTVLDIDALDKTEKTSWVNHGLNCLYPNDDLCLVTLSVGGEDADTLREFSLKQGKFVEGGFVVPHSKNRVSWLDKDTLLVARDWGADSKGVSSLTPSGYPYIVKEWHRGTPLESAKEVFRGEQTDEAASAYTINDPQGHSLTVYERQVDFFGSKTFVMTSAGLKQLDVPAKSGLGGMLDGRVMLSIEQDWKPTGSAKTFKQGSLLSMKLAELQRDPGHLKPSIVFEPTVDEFMQGARTTHSRLLITTLKHVQGTAYVYTPTATGWTKKALPVPANVSVDIADTSSVDETFYLIQTGFLTPTTLYRGDAATGALSMVKSQPAQFDASNDVVEQLEATSKDGTKVPYFVVHRKDMKHDGSNPTLLNAYGGFQVSETPSYSAVTGKLWLERGGVFVLANIRGGGEFGPAWHEAGLKGNRQRIYDDFAAVGQDLIARKITSTPHLGILGGSNGGLLMGVEMEQHPDLWNAVVIQVPLLDMLRFEHIAAGASWVAEYGSVSVPAERAFLEKISPYNNLRPDVKYPEPLIFTTTRDDRVGPQHARKLAAKMEEFHEPFFYDEITEGGHGAGADLKQESRSRAEVYVYLAEKLMAPVATAPAAGGR